MDRAMIDRPRDTLNRPLLPGDVVAYPNRFSSSMWVNLGVVQSVDLNEDGNFQVKVKLFLTNYKGEFSGKRKLTTVSRYDRMTITGMNEAQALEALS